MNDLRSRSTIRSCRLGDAARVCAIYNHYVDATVVTFEERPVAADEMSQRIAEAMDRWPWLVCECDGELVGYAYAAPWKSRSAYRFAVESTIYLAPGNQHQGLGTRLYTRLIEELRASAAHCVIAGISLPNAASVALHEKLGFHKIGLFEQVGWKLGRWVDVGYWELVLNVTEKPDVGR